MKTLIAEHEPPQPRVPRDTFVDLIDAIVSQQLSVKAAASIFARVEALFPEGGMTPAALAAIDGEKLREVGLSRAKVRYVQGIASAVLAGEFDPSHLDALDDEEVIGELIRLKGAGRWTAEMLLIFSLGRTDVFPVGDLGIRTAVARHYGIEREAHEEILAIAERWRPYRSLACHYLWKSLAKVPLA